MNDLVTWLHERITADETDTRELLYRAQQTTLTLEDPKLLGRYIPGWYDWPAVESMCRQHLASIAADRLILAEHSPHRDGACPVCWRHEPGLIQGETFPCRTLRLRASPYADRPGYRDEWRPE